MGRVAEKRSDKAQFDGNRPTRPPYVEKTCFFKKALPSAEENGL